jgi:diadenosine tetraphosphate (Ap4A) HIT family hydrolase
MRNCPFCNIAEPLAVNELAVAIFDKYPVTDGHSLVMPKRHITDPAEMTEDETRAVLELITHIRAHLDMNFQPDGYNIGVNIGRAAGQSIMHVHIHVIPRYTGDRRIPKGGVRGVIPEKQDY